MHVIRNSAFETNSSSTHAACMQSADVFDMALPQEYLRSGIIKLSNPIVSPHQFARIYRPENIASYLVATAIGYAEGKPGEDILKKYADHPVLKPLLKHLRNITKCDFEFPMPPSGQLIADVRSPANIKYDDPAWLNSLLFSSGSYIQMRYDDDDYPMYIETDLPGRRELFIPNLFDVSEQLDRAFTLKTASSAAMDYEDDEGIQHLVELNWTDYPDFFPLDAFSASIVGCEIAIDGRVDNPEMQSTMREEVMNMLHNWIWLSISEHGKVLPACKFTMREDLPVKFVSAEGEHPVKPGFKMFQSVKIDLKTDAGTLEKIRENIVDAYQTGFSLT